MNTIFFLAQSTCKLFFIDTTVLLERVKKYIIISGIKFQFSLGFFNGLLIEINLGKNIT